MNRSVSIVRRLVFAMVLLVPALADAHVGVGETSGFIHGLTHPLFGLDHVCAMVAVGLWAAQLGGRSLWVVPLTFVSVMVLGGMLGMLGVELPFVEQGIVLSVLMLGVLIAAAVRLPLWVSSGVVGVFALFHGHAHGAEMPVETSGLTYAIGFVLATASLHLSGVAFGAGMRRLLHKGVISATGAGIALYGVYLAVA